MTVLAIDQSTSATAAFLLDGGQSATCIYDRTHRQIYPHPGWVEHDPEELLSNVAAALQAGQAAGATMVGLSNQGESCLIWDARDGRPLSPVLVWQDSRTAAFCADLAAEAGPDIIHRARLPVDPYFSASKLRWCLDQIPGAGELARAGHLRMGTTDAFFRHRLGGRCETDLATASRTGLLNFDTGDWDDTLCQLYGVPRAALPAITDCSGDLGQLGTLPLRAAIVDQQAALYGHGLSRPGDTKITFGTGAFALSLAGTTPPAYGHGALPTVAWREAGAAPVYALDGGVHTASAALNWARDLGLFDRYEDLGGYHGHALARGLAFVPALAGLACPHWQDAARGTWLGLGLDTDRAAMLQALIEGIAYRSREVLEAMGADGTVAQTIHIDGGMTQNKWICQCLANVTGRAMAVAAMPDATALGLCRMAARAAGLSLPDLPEPRLHHPEPGFTPLPERFAAARRSVQGWAQTCARAQL